MWTRPFACALVGSVLLACGSRADLSGSRATTSDAGTLPGAAAMRDAGISPGVAACVVAALAESAGPCQATESACVNVDLSTYDRSCRSNSDCIPVVGGMTCPSGCACPNAAINASGRAHYEQTMARLRPVNGDCSCANDRTPNPVCVQGACTYER